MSLPLRCEGHRTCVSGLVSSVLRVGGFRELGSRIDGYVGLPVSHDVFVSEKFMQGLEVAFSSASQEEASCEDRAVFLGSLSCHYFLSLPVFYYLFSFLEWCVQEAYSI